MFRRLLLLAVVAACALPARAGALTTLLPGVTYERTVEFTPHGPVVLNVLTAPRPGDQNGLYQLAPVLAHATVLGAREPVTQIERDVSAQATVAGINGDLFGADGHPAGIFMSGGVLAHKPFSARSSIGVDAAGVLHVDRVKFFGTWRGTGQRRTLDGLNQVPVPGQVVLLTPAFGPAAPVLPGSAEVVLQSFPATVPNADLSAPVTAVGTGGGESIPPGGAIIQAAGPLAAAKLQAEAPVGAQVATRLILQPPEPGVVAALGGGPVLVRNSAPVFRALEDFTSAQIAARSPRAAVGQLADGRIILAAVDGDQAGYSIGLTSFELAQTMARLGAVTASALESGPDVTMAFDGQLLNAPSAGGERAVREALLVQYYGVYAPPAAVAAPHGRARQDGGAAELQDRPPIPGHGPVDRARRQAPGARGRRPARPGHVLLPVDDLRRGRDLALERQRHRRPEAHLGDRPDVPLRHHPDRLDRAEARPRNRCDPLHALAPGERESADRDPKRCGPARPRRR